MMMESKLKMLEMVRKFNSDDDIRDLIAINIDCALNSQSLSVSERRKVWEFSDQLRSLVE